MLGIIIINFYFILKILINAQSFHKTIALFKNYGEYFTVFYDTDRMCYGLFILERCWKITQSVYKKVSRVV